MPGYENSPGVRVSGRPSLCVVLRALCSRQSFHTLENRLQLAVFADGGSVEGYGLWVKFSIDRLVLHLIGALPIGSVTFAGMAVTRAARVAFSAIGFTLSIVPPDTLSFLIDECLHASLVEVANRLGYVAYHFSTLD